eukprot:CAMPEP_0204569456 /NCGR_PEP_ID=MMETSP0661-20131031/37750_1 /ASSEMBLY_ACC=CAM_ASM_000606 /TAXON_ID=109239 /ORGANISM="Alexandrium margalefi, Strain AMGDE01CS-322" /LENGTH=304 /DNA_ID=CAMNT_0051577555 /DNA_START=26 /DNA_END=940 /DNA_ORIENTATION=-
MEEQRLHREELIAVHDCFVRASGPMVFADASPDFEPPPTPAGSTSVPGLLLDQRGLRRFLLEQGLVPLDKDIFQDLESRITMFSLSKAQNGLLNFKEVLRLLRELRGAQARQAGQDLASLFVLFDKDRSGYLSLDEVFAVIGHLGLAPRCREDQVEMHQLLKEIDVDNSGTLSCKEFEVLAQKFDNQLRAVERHREIVEGRKLGFHDSEVFALREAFFALEREALGKLGVETLRQFTSRLNGRLNNQAIEEAFEQADKDFSGELSFVGFLQFARITRTNMARLQHLLSTSMDINPFSPAANKSP